jgi:hypothetical protein
LVRAIAHKRKKKSKVEGFSRWSVTIYKIVLLSFVRRLNYKIITLQRFGSWILLRLQVEKGEGGQKACLLGPLIELALDLDSYNIEMPEIRILRSILYSLSAADSLHEVSGIPKENFCMLP